ncbi:MAG: DUF1684 domain-containing protein [Candidatus Krumholzibacteriia bacterium]
MSAKLLFLVLVGVVLLPLLGCGDDPAPGPVAMDPAELERWEIALVEWRIEKNEEFMAPDTTPLPAEMLAGFEGLDYYFPAAEYRFRTALERAAQPDTVMLARHKGDEAPYVVVGKVRFRIAGRDLALTVYGPAQPGAGDLFLPFYDLTNGETTCPEGRYVDLDAAADGTVDLDFNKAYNPLCSYGSEQWNCVLPPPENRLPVRVEAGEKRLTAAVH